MNTGPMYDGPRGDVLPTPPIDMDEVRRYRLLRLREQLATHDVAMAVLTNPLSLRYAVDFREYQLFQSRIPSVTLFVPADGPVAIFGSYHPIDLVDEYEPGLLLNTFDGGVDRGDRGGQRLADAIARHLDHIRAPKRSRVAIERMFAEDLLGAADRLSEVTFVDADRLMELARVIKSPGEIECMRHSIAVAEHAIDQMRVILQPGVTENELLSVIHRVNIANDGSWLDGRMLASGHRTNPWLQEATDKPVAAGELVGLDTDMIGPFGYCADISRTFLCGGLDGEVAPTPAQRDVYRHAYDEVHANIELIRPGMRFSEISQKAFTPRPEFVARRYPCLAHGVGMADEYPQIKYQPDWERAGYDGVLEPNMTLCVESYTGSEHGGEGVKLEEMVLVTETGCEVLTNYPFETELLA